MFNLIDLLNPDFVVNSHDEEKEMKGLVGKFAKIKYPEIENIKLTHSTFIPINDYQTVPLD